MFDPTVGRLLEEDPEGFSAGDMNLYRYVKNSPTNFTDPSGLQADDDRTLDPEKADARGDKVFETEVTNIQQAIEEKTLTPAKGYHQELIRNADQSVVFLFDKAYAGTYLLGKNKVIGAYVKLRIGVKESKHKHQQLRVIQLVRDVTKVGDKLVPADPIYYLFRMRSGFAVPAPGAALGGPGARALAPIATSGWRVDATNAADSFWGHIDHDFFPVLGSTVPGYVRDELPKVPKESRPTMIDRSYTIWWDAPGHSPPGTKGVQGVPGKDTGREFITCLIGWDGDAVAPTYIASVRWGYYVDGKGNVKFMPDKPVVDEKAPPELKEALERWNVFISAVANDPKKLTNGYNTIDNIKGVGNIKVPK
jgi:hypothetical protein